MAVSRDLLLAKAKANVSALTKLNAKEREGRPNQSFMADYNKLRAAFLETVPEAEPLAPPEAKQDEKSMFIQADCNYAEMLAFSEQIVAMLDSQKK